MYQPVINSYFSGGGGFDLGLQQAGCRIQQSLEIDKRAAETLRLNFDHEVVETDIKLKTVLEQPEADAMVAGYPCTKYSAISDIHGTRTGDDLYLHFFRHVALRQPHAYLLENVPGMKKFPVVMEAMTKLPGYYINLFCPVKTSTWLPQRRKRLLVFGTRRPWNISPPENTRRVTLAEIVEEGAKIEFTKCVIARLEGKYRDMPIVSDPEKGDIAPTAVAHYGKDKGTRMIADKRSPYGARPYTVREYARLQGFPDSFKFAGGVTSQFQQIGNAVPVPMARWAGEQLVRYFN